MEASGANGSAPDAGHREVMGSAQAVEVSAPMEPAVLSSVLSGWHDRILLLGQLRV